MMLSQYESPEGQWNLFPQNLPLIQMVINGDKQYQAVNTCYLSNHK